MSFRRTGHGTNRSRLFKITSISLSIVMVSLYFTGLVVGQRRTFTAKPITGGHVTSRAKSDMPRPNASTPQSRTSRKGVAQRGMQAQALSGPYDVTIAPGPSPAGGYLPLSGFGITP